MKMKSMSSIQKVATLSMVFMRTTSCLLSAGMNLTSFSTRSSLKVLNTDRPPSDWPTISHTLERRGVKKHMSTDDMSVKYISRLEVYQDSGKNKESL